MFYNRKFFYRCNRITLTLLFAKTFMMFSQPMKEIMTEELFGQLNKNIMCPGIQ